MFQVHYYDNAGDDFVESFDSVEGAESYIEKFLECCIEDLVDYDYCDFGDKLELWVPNEDVYSVWERMWRQ